MDQKLKRTLSLNVRDNPYPLATRLGMGEYYSSCVFSVGAQAADLFRDERGDFLRF